VRRIGVWSAFTVALMACATAPPASAAVPAGNGKIVFTSDEGAFTRQLLTIEPDGSQRTRIVDRGEDPVWSPDGTKIAYVTPSTHGPSQLVIVNADGTGATTPTGTDDQEFEPSWSPDGTKIAFTSHVPRGQFVGFEIFVMNIDGTGRTQITDSRADGVGFNASEPSWSPDGTRIAFTRTISQAGNQPLDEEIYVMNADGSNLVRLTHNPSTFVLANDLGPSWSPDGSQIVFSSHRDGQFGVHVMNADGSGLRRLADAPAGSWPVWSPDGTRIAYANPFHDIFTIKLDGRDVRNLTSTSGISELKPDWQPVNRGPNCSEVRATPGVLGPPNHRLVTVTLSGATDPDGDAVRLEITGVRQDEPVGSAPDSANGTAANQVRLRAERDGGGDGRVYQVAFEASDDRGGTCTDAVNVGVPKGSGAAVNSAPPSYDSFTPSATP
jgi:dipeptidyl aminopeptidase/acylaminoacyl peptidase